MLELRFKNRSYSAVVIDRPRITLGSDPGNDVVLPESGVAEFQMELFRQDGQVLAVDLTGSGCKKNGQPIQGSDAIVGGDLLSLESIEIEVVDPLLATEKFDASDLLAADRVPEPVDVISAGVEGNEMAAVLAAANDSSSAWSLKGLNESVVGLRFPLGGKVVIGRDPSCDLVLDLPQISRRHTEIEVLNSQLFLRDLGSTNGSSVNGQSVSSATVRPGDTVSIDVVEFEVEGPDDDQENTIARSFAIDTNAPIGPYLLIRSGDRAGEKILLVNSRYSIGRTPGNDIVLEDQSISKRHALIIRTDGGWKIEDCESTNGTSINGETVMGGQLHHADRVRVGSIKIAFIVPDMQEKEKVGEVPPVAGFDPNATMRSVAMKMPRDYRNYYLGGGVGAILLLMIVAGLMLVDRAPRVELESITAPLTISSLWHRQLPGQRSYPTAPLLADINGDGYLDVAIADGGGHLLVLDGEEGKRIFDMPVAGRVVAGPVAADLTGDGIDDLVIASYEGLVYAVNGKAQVLWKTAFDSGYGMIKQRAELRDLTASGTPDLLLASSDKGLVALDGGSGRELWNSSAIGLKGASGIPLSVGLTDDDGDELVVTTSIGEVWALSVGTGGLSALWTRELPEGLVSSPVSAMSEQGRIIIVASKPGGIYGLFGNSGLIAWRFSDHGPYAAAPVVVTNADGTDQVVVVSQSGVATALTVSGGKTIWQREVGEQVLADVALFDVTNDGQADLLLADRSGRLIAIDSTNGKLLVSSEKQSAAGYLASPVIGDINNDQLAEVVVADQKGGITAYTINRSLLPGTTPWARSQHLRVGRSLN